MKWELHVNDMPCLFVVTAKLARFLGVQNPQEFMLRLTEVYQGFYICKMSLSLSLPLWLWCTWVFSLAWSAAASSRRSAGHDA